MKYIIYYLTPSRRLYELLKDTMTITYGTAAAKLKTSCFSYEEFEQLTKLEKIQYIKKYIESNNTLKYLDNNLLAILGIVLAIIGILV